MQQSHEGTAAGRPASASALLTGFSRSWTAEQVTLDELVDVLGDRVYGLLFLMLAIPNMIPGVALVLGIPLVIIAGQMVLGWRKPRLPRVLGKRGLRTDDVRRIIDRATPWLARAEHMLRPRGLFLFTPAGERVLGLIILLMGIILLLPIWGANFLPALAICLIALALVEFDGLMALLGFIAAAASVAIASGVIYAALKVMLFLIAHAFD